MILSLGGTLGETRLHVIVVNLLEVWEAHHHLGHWKYPKEITSLFAERQMQDGATAQC